VNNIQKLTIDDYSDIFKLWEEAGMKVKIKGRDHPNQLKRQIDTGNVAILGKSMDNKLVGIILVSHDDRKGWLNRLAVHPSYRRQGIAKELVSAAEEYLIDEYGIEIFSTLIFKDNIASTTTFRSLGYEEWNEVSYFSKRINPDI
jgi:ribosomal protein S18 acetylase RimI-like enzyme